MTLHITAEALTAVTDCLSFFYGRSVGDIEDESTVPANIVRRILEDAVDKGTVERKGNKYRIDNASPWREGYEPPEVWCSDE